MQWDQLDRDGRGLQQRLRDSTTGDFCTATSGTAIQCTTASTGSGSVVLAASPSIATPTLTGTITLSGLTTAGPVLTNASGVLSSSATLSGTYGGTGVNNGSNTITLGGNITTAGALSLPAVTTGDILYGSAANTLSALAIGTIGQVLTVSAGGLPSWSNPASGGLSSTLATNNIFVGNGSSVATAVALSGDCTLTYASGINCTKTNGNAILSGSYFNTALFPALTGDVTSTAGGVTTTISKIQGMIVSGVTGTGNVVFSNSPTLTGTVAGASSTWSGTVVATGTVSGATPTSSANLATKAYVDSAVAGAGGSGAPVNFQVFNSSGTWTMPGSGSMAYVQCWGAGGGGGGTNTTTALGGGGGGGGYAYAWFPLSSLASTVSVTIGAGGAGGSTSANGSTGSSSTFGSYLTATGGGGGSKGVLGGGAGAGGSGGGGSGSNVAYSSGAPGSDPNGGNAASGSMSGGGGGTQSTSGGTPGGGVGGGDSSSGAAGAAGECVVTTY